MNPLVTASLILLGSLAGIEGVSYGWTHPARDNEVVRLVPDLATPDPEAGPGAEWRPLPEVYRKAAPMLRCTDGRTVFVRTPEGVTLNLSFFEWLGTDTGSVLEAFRHVPEICLGSVGLQLVANEPALTHRVDGRPLVFEHQVFREPGDLGGLPTSLIHSFRAVWVSGSDHDARKLAIDSRQRLRAIRLECAVKRERPPYACVVQGAVRGALTGEAAWEAFQREMLQGMKFENQS